MEINIILIIRPIIKRIIIAGMDANTHFIINDTIEPKGISKSVIFIGCILYAFLEVFFLLLWYAYYHFQLIQLMLFFHSILFIPMFY